MKICTEFGNCKIRQGNLNISALVMFTAWPAAFPFTGASMEQSVTEPAAWERLSLKPTCYWMFHQCRTHNSQCQANVPQCQANVPQ